MNVVDFIAGWMGGITVLIVGHPFDSVKVWQQSEAFHAAAAAARASACQAASTSCFASPTYLLEEAEARRGRAAAAAAADAGLSSTAKGAVGKGEVLSRTGAGIRWFTNHVFTSAAQVGPKGSIRCAVEMYEQEGLRAFYRGLMAPMAAVGIANGALFGTFNALITALEANKRGEYLGGYHEPHYNLSSGMHSSSSSSSNSSTPYSTYDRSMSGNVGYEQNSSAPSSGGIFSWFSSSPSVPENEYYGGNTQAYNVSGGYDDDGYLYEDDYVESDNSSAKYGGGVMGFLRSKFSKWNGSAKTEDFSANSPIKNRSFDHNIDDDTLSKRLRDSAQLSAFEYFIAAAGGGVAFATVMTPFEVVKIRLQTHHLFPDRQYFGAMHCARTLYRLGGIRSLFKGYEATLLRDTLGTGAYLGSYGLIVQAIGVEHSYSVPSILFAGGCAGVVQWLVIFPADTIKTRMQISEKGQFRDWVHCARVLYQQRGISGFYFGIAPALCRAFCSNAVGFVGIEGTMQLLA